MKDVKLISAGRILENNKTVGDCRNPVCNLSGAVTTMHVIIQPQITEKGNLYKQKIIYKHLNESFTIFLN